MRAITTNRVLGFVAFTALGASISATACVSTTCTETHQCWDAGDGGGPVGETGVPDSSVVGNDAGADADAGPDAPDVTVCDPSRTPSENACVIDEAYGIFVSPSGSDSNAGTRAAPVATVGHGIDVAKAAGKRTYVCAGSFQEKLVVGASRDGAAVFGGFDCATWTYAATNRVVVAPAQAVYALELDALVRGATFEDVEFDAKDANPANAGESSIAVFANGSQNVALHRVTLVAGSATPGAPGASGATSADPSNWVGTAPSYPELNGMSAGDAGGAPAVTCTCKDGKTSTGGAGGSALLSGNRDAGVGLPSYGSGAGGTAGTNSNDCSAGGLGFSGVDAPAGPPNAPITSLGALSASGWQPAAGAPGSNGKPGQGGGGGGNGRSSTGGGGGGACGGCGGAGGKAGGGGGSSIALLAYQSGVSLVNCTLAAKTAGPGGTGGNGEQGQAGGGGGVQFVPGCSGGGGGAGSGGNGAQGGAGGLSLGIGYSGTPPTVDGTAVTQAAASTRVTVAASGGLGGAKGTAGPAASPNFGQPGADGTAGPSGVAQAVLGL